MPPNNLSLKQRLAALSLSPSSPSSPHSPNLDNSILSPRRAKALFTPPWIKKNEPGLSVRREYNELEVVQEVMGRMIFQAGVDFE
jgi:Rho GTPase-activating protein 1